MEDKAADKILASLKKANEIAEKAQKEGLWGKLKSRKLFGAVIGGCLSGIAGYFELSPEIVAIIAGIFGVQIAAQGHTDAANAKYNNKPKPETKLKP